MFLIVNLNPAIDRIYQIPGFQLNQIHRTAQVLAQAGGKGINVARASRILGQAPLVTGFLGGFHGQLVQADLKKAGILHDFSPIEQETRTCLILIDPEQNTQTVVNEQGPVIAEFELQLFLNKFAALVSRVSLVLFSGSIPSALFPGIYRDLIQIAHCRQVPCLLDASQAALKEAMEAVPEIVKVNLQEFHDVFCSSLHLRLQCWPEDFAELWPFAKTMFIHGTKHVVITLGGAGAVWFSPQECAWIHAPEVRAVNTIGSGDAMAAAMACELVENPHDMRQALISGIAAGTANATTGGLRFSLELYTELRNQVWFTPLHF